MSYIFKEILHPFYYITCWFYYVYILSLFWGVFASSSSRYCKNLPRITSKMKVLKVFNNINMYKLWSMGILFWQKYLYWVLLVYGYTWRIPGYVIIFFFEKKLGIAWIRLRYFWVRLGITLGTGLMKLRHFGWIFFPFSFSVPSFFLSFNPYPFSSSFFHSKPLTPLLLLSFILIEIQKRITYPLLSFIRNTSFSLPLSSSFFHSKHPSPTATTTQLLH